MPFKSQAQRRKFAQLLVEGKISPETFEEWNRETGSAKLPDHVKGAKTAKRRGARRTSRTKTVKRAGRAKTGKRAAKRKTARRR